MPRYKVVTSGNLQMPVEVMDDQGYVVARFYDWTNEVSQTIRHGFALGLAELFVAAANGEPQVAQPLSWWGRLPSFLKRRRT